MHRTNSDSFRSYFCFHLFRLSFASDFCLLLVEFHQAQSIIVKHRIQERNDDDEAWVGVEPSTLRSWPSYNSADKKQKPFNIAE